MQSLQDKNVLYHLNPHLFIYLRAGEFIVWDYLNHKQWVVNGEYINALERVSKNQRVSMDMIDDLVDSGLIMREQLEDIEWGWDIVSKIYHLSSSNIFEDVRKSKDEFVEEYRATCETLSILEESKISCDYEFEAQFETTLEEMPLGRVFKTRKTTRNFDGSSVAYRTLGCLLYATCGEIHGEWSDLEEAGYTPFSKRRSFPSGGGLYPMRYIVLVLNVDGIHPGVYEYIPSANGLKKIKSLEREDASEELTDILSSQFFSEGLAAGIFFVTDFAKEWEKYPHSRSYRDVFLDIAHCSQNTLLAATALGLRTWMTAAFKDEKLRQFLGIEQPYTYPVEFVAVGHGEDHSLPAAFRGN